MDNNYYILHSLFISFLWQRKYVRTVEGSTSTKQFHQGFKTWTLSKNSAGMTEEEWQTLMNEDELHPYEDYPTTNPPAPPSMTNQSLSPENENQHISQDPGDTLHPMYGHFNPQY